MLFYQKLKYIMKSTFFIVFCVLTSISYAQNFSIDASFEEDTVEAPVVEEVVQINNWLTNLEEAKAIAKRERKPILLYFTGSDWCAPCVSLKKDFFETEEFVQYQDEFVMVYIDLPRRLDIISPEQMEYNKKIIAKYKTNTFPRMMILDSSGREKDDLHGYSSYNTYKDTSHHFNMIKKYI
ncbi:hypothetical protein SCB49_10587 [unidentified eubacterium SCB49]|nr:hypothetical protein SCB49_10587 [unidentified eubacterium SCB49]